MRISLFAAAPCRAAQRKCPPVDYETASCSASGPWHTG